MVVIRENKKKTERVIEEMKKIYLDDEKEQSNLNITVFNGNKKMKGIPDFTMLFQLMSLQLSRELKPASCKVLFYLLCITDYYNFVGININTLQEQLKLSKATVINAMNQLKELHVLISIKDNLDKRRNVYCLNPAQSWKGSFVKRKKAIALIENQISLEFDTMAEKEKEKVIKDIQDHYGK